MTRSVMSDMKQLLIVSIFRILKDDTIDLCTVLKPGLDYRDAVIWVAVVATPFLLGPVLSLVLECVCCVGGVVTTDNTRRQQQLLVCLLSVLTTLSYSTSLYLTEEFFQPLFNLNIFSSFLLKYFCGSLHLVLVPAFICLLDIDIRHGVVCVYRRKRTRSYTGTLR